MVKNRVEVSSEKRLSWDNSNDLDVVNAALSDSKVVVGTSDTVPGLLAVLTKEGSAKLDAIKGRKDKPYIILIANKNLLEKFAIVYAGASVQIENLIGQCWPGPLTLIFKARPRLDPWLVAPNGTISLRVPQHEGLLKLLQHVDGLFSTSANKTGNRTPQMLDEVDPAILAEVALCIGDAVLRSGETKPSTILDCTGDRIKMVREGALSRVALESMCGGSIE